MTGSRLQLSTIYPRRLWASVNLIAVKCAKFLSGAAVAILDLQAAGGARSLPDRMRIEFSRRDWIKSPFYIKWQVRLRIASPLVIGRVPALDRSEVRSVIVPAGRVWTQDRHCAIASAGTRPVERRQGPRREATQALQNAARGKRAAGGNGSVDRFGSALAPPTPAALVVA
jgi:hypothetical protein